MDEEVQDVLDGLGEAAAEGLSSLGLESAIHPKIDMMPALVIVLAVAASSILLEALSWLFVYRTAEYRRLVREVEEHYKAFTKLKHAPSSDKDLPRKRKRLDEAMMKTAREFATTVRMRTGVLTFVVLFIVYRLITSRYSGVVVGRLPFYPPAFITRLTHNSIKGEDLLECSALFVYVLCGLAVRSNISKFFNQGPNRAVSAIMSPQNVLDKSKYD